eukprot:7690942-Alexandrium_andersonii.AAC.1
MRCMGHEYTFEVWNMIDAVASSRLLECQERIAGRSSHPRSFPGVASSSSSSRCRPELPHPPQSVSAESPEPSQFPSPTPALAEPSVSELLSRVAALED